VKEEIKKLALYRLSRAKESFEDGELLFKKGSLKSAINRFYYAAFYAARALLATKGLDSSKHSGVISLFQQYFVKTGVIPADISKILPRSFEERIDSDYEDFISVAPQDVEKIRQGVKTFLDTCQKIFENIVNSEGS
jgi:uncharacterized protein (UPF0332 family)